MQSILSFNNLSIMLILDFNFSTSLKIYSCLFILFLLYSSISSTDFIELRFKESMYSLIFFIFLFKSNFILLNVIIFSFFYTEKSLKIFLSLFFSFSLRTKISSNNFSLIFS
jgi:hypothetical protein